MYVRGWVQLQQKAYSTTSVQLAGDAVAVAAAAEAVAAADEDASAGVVAERFEEQSHTETYVLQRPSEDARIQEQEVQTDDSSLALVDSHMADS